MLARVGGDLWRQMGSGDWYTVAEVAPGLYAYRYSSDPSHLVLAPSCSGAGGLAGNSEAQPEEPGALESATGPAGGANGI